MTSAGTARALPLQVTGAFFHHDLLPSSSGSNSSGGGDGGGGGSNSSSSSGSSSSGSSGSSGGGSGEGGSCAGGGAGVGPLVLHQSGSAAWLQQRSGAPVEVKQEQECGAAEQRREEYLRADGLWD